MCDCASAIHVYIGTAKKSDPENCEAEVVLRHVKRKAEEHPEQSPAQLLRNVLADVPPDVLSQLPQREAMRKTIGRTRRQHLPPNPKSLDALLDLPQQYQQTLQGERFLSFDGR
ncbi:hypothetical protein V9T40_007822 [Parthenolecanium corni]|uniref:Uncharacterized protein n=1 Tax=Parthenolecanium corni TaxID=536013 RepID=A0AAN9THT8_9HEMI